jgi:hypothetical protein
MITVCWRIFQVKVAYSKENKKEEWRTKEERDKDEVDYINEK